MEFLWFMCPALVSGYLLTVAVRRGMRRKQAVRRLTEAM